jgi:putative tricarboxylic transport membrane protein
VANSDTDAHEARGEGGDTSPSPLIHGVDLGVAVIVLVFCGWTYWLTTGFDEVSPLLTQNIPPEWFPRLLIWTIGVLTLVLPFEHRFLKAGREGLDKDRKTRIPPMVFITAGLLCLTVLGIKVLGTFLTMILICVVLPVLWGERRWKVLLPFAVIFPIIVAVVFTQFLKVYFEPGMFGLDLS